MFDYPIDIASATTASPKEFSYKSDYYPYIAGKPWKSLGQKAEDVVNPYNDEVLAKVHLATRDDILAALDAAEEAQKTWGRSMAKDREAILIRAADIVERRRMDIAKVLIEEGGNVFGKAMFEVDYMISAFRIAAGQAREILGETMPAEGVGRISLSFREPVGTVVGIGPFNAPLLLNGKKLAPALAAGNCFILKPSPYTPLTALLFAEILEEAGLPTGVLSVIPTSDEALGDLLFSDPRTSLITFTGSAKVGNMLSGLAGKYSKPIVLELGGKSPVVILKDADLDYAVRSAAFGIYFNQGQVCMANSRIIVEEPIYDAFCQAFAEKVKSIAVGDPSLPETAVGPAIAPRQEEVFRQHINDAVAKGGKLLVGGRVKGHVCEPSVLVDITSDMQVCDDETFASLVTIYKAKDFEEAVSIANDTTYGLSSGIITNNLQKAFEFAQQVDAGSVHINDNAFDDDPNAPFGGYKGSGYGKENGRHSIEAMTKVKWVTIQMGERPLPF